MQLLSHQTPIIAFDGPGQPKAALLSDAFAGFIAASSRLEASYEKLQLDVTYLSCELADRNSALKMSLAENERIHRALQQVVDSMPCGVLVVEDDGTVFMINPEGRRLLSLGESPADHLDMITSESGLNLAGFLQRHTGEDREQEFCRPSPAGKRWLSVHDRRSLYGDELELFGRRQTILVLRDITLHKQAEEQRERARKATALAEIATTLAHEIRNPLASLELFAGLIAKGGDDVTEYISHIHAGIRSLSGTVNNVLSFHGVGFPALVSLDLAAAIRSSVEFARPIAQQAGIDILFHTDESDVRIFGNSSALQQVMLNMVSNAIRHSSPQGQIRVSVSEVRRTPALNSRIAVIAVSDKGCGISPEDIKHIFRAGFSVSGSTSGLGLAVCAQIVKQHDGEIRVEGALGAGTTFYVEIPAL